MIEYEDNEIILFDTSIASYNKGDEIIMRSIDRVLSPWFKCSDVYRLPTHTPVCTELESKKNDARLSFFENISTKFLCGTDIISKRRNYFLGQWNANFLNYAVYRNVVCLAVGWSEGANETKNLIKNYIYKINTENFYKKTLRKDVIHSARDNETAKYLEELGFSAINTGCVTTWMLTPKFCKSIKCNKSPDVLFTLNCRRRMVQEDIGLIEMLKRNYRKVFFFPQQHQDIDYYNSLKIDGVEIIPPNIDFLDSFLSQREIDYVGVRLHCGIFAMQKKKRAIILCADHRSSDISETQNLNLVQRNDIKLIEKMINSDFATDIRVDYDNINIFLHQFGLSLGVDGEKVNLYKYEEAVQ